MNYFILELDTTSPVIEIECPEYTTKREPLPIIIQADEALDSWHDVFIIDSQGTRHNVILTLSGDKFEGFISFNEVYHGMATIFARTRDEVFNVSNIAQKAVLVMADAEVFLEISISEGQAEIQLVEAIMPILVSEVVMVLVSTEKTQDIDTSESAREIELSVEWE
jgi:hypothetical protein